MKRLILIGLMLSTVGCKGLNRLIDGKTPDEIADKQPINPLSGQPDFGIAVPTGYSRTIFYGMMPADHKVSVTPSSNSMVRVFIRDGGQVNHWFQINSQYSEAFWYSSDPGTFKIEYQGVNLGGHEYCIYQDIHD